MNFESDVAALDELVQRLSSDYGRHELNRITKAARALSELAQAGTSEQHVQRTTLAAQRFQQSLKDARGSLTQRERGGLQSLAEARKERLGLQTDKAFLPVVTAFQNADSASRLRWLNDAVQTGDGRVLAALIETPHYVHGIAPEVLAKHLDLAEQKHAPDLAERRARFDADRDVVRTALDQGERIAAKAVDLESVQAAERADKAEAELQAATG